VFRARCAQGCEAASLEVGRARCTAHGSILVRVGDEAHRHLAPLLGLSLDGRIDLVGVLGVGGFATVYLGMDRALPRLVAVKVLHNNRAGDEKVRRRFEAEGRVLAALSGDQIVRAFSAGAGYARSPRAATQPVGARVLYLVTEYIRGWPLGQLIEVRGAWPVQEVLELARQLLTGLAEAHLLGIIHRDLKPNNVMVSENALGQLQVKVLDFGVAKMLGWGNTTTGMGQLVGTARYMAPEQLLGQPVSASTDLFGLAVLLYEVLEARPLFAGDTYQGLLATRLAGGTPPLPEHWPEGLSRSLARRPEDRYQTARAMASALEGLMNDATPSFAELRGANPPTVRSAAADTTVNAMPIQSVPVSR
jgi:eukaryotic-like serine/threonine-protein kinase